MIDIFPSFFAGRKSPPPPAASAASAANGLGATRVQRMQQGAVAEISYGGLADVAGRGNLAHPKAATVLAATAPSPPSPSPSRSARRAQPVGDLLTWKRRAPTLEHNAGLPHEWAESLAKLFCGSPPQGFDPAYWARSVEGAAIFANQWIGHAFRSGWSAEDVFGLDDIAPAARHDSKGLAWLLPDGKHVVALDAAGADIETGRGVRQRFYRMNETIPGTRKREAP